MGIVQVPEGRQVFGPMTVEDNLRLGAFARGTQAATLDSVFALFPALQRQAPRARRQPVRRPAADAGDRPRADGASRDCCCSTSRAWAWRRAWWPRSSRTSPALKARGTTILLVDQNARAALAIADRGYVMETGRIVLDGAAADLLHNPQVQQAYMGL